MNLKSKNKISTDFSMASMTDIIFLILLFFMISSSVVSETVLDVSLPKSKGNTIESKRIVVEISEDKNYALNGKIIPKNSLENSLNQEVKNVDKPIIVLRADKKTAYDEVVYVMSIAYKNRYKVVLATQPSQ